MSICTGIGSVAATSVMPGSPFRMRPMSRFDALVDMMNANWFGFGPTSIMTGLPTGRFGKRKVPSAKPCPA